MILQRLLTVYRSGQYHYQYVIWIISTMLTNNSTYRKCRMIYFVYRKLFLTWRWVFFEEYFKLCQLEYYFHMWARLMLMWEYSSRDKGLFKILLFKYKLPLNKLQNVASCIHKIFVLKNFFEIGLVWSMTVMVILLTKRN